MSDTTTTTPASSFFLDGAAPRLSTGVTATPTSDAVPGPASSSPNGSALPVVSPVLSSTEAPVLPTLPTPAAEPVAVATTTASEPRHPMAHLMPEKTAPSEASRRAAEIRAAQKAKSKRIKIGIIAGVIAVGALAGPPTFRWLRDAVNESGRVGGETTVEQPAD